MNNREQEGVLHVRTVSGKEYIFRMSKAKIDETWNAVLIGNRDDFVVIGDSVFNRRHIESFNKE